MSTLLQTTFDMSAVWTILQAATSAAVFSITYYAKKWKRDDEEFKPEKFGATVLVGVLIGVSAVLAGEPLSEVSWESQMAAYAGIVALVEGLIKSIITDF